MKISTKGRYGLRLMIDLGVSYNKGLVPLKEVASRQDISDKYLEQIIMQLNRAGFVRSTRGAHGGYALAMPPEQITVGDVLRVLEGSLAPVDCVDCDKPDCDRVQTCVTYSVWMKIKEAVEDVVDNITLGSLVDEYNTRGQLCYNI